MGSQDPRAQYLSNKTHYSSVDPDARIAVKPGKPTQLVYSGQLSVDTSNHVITNIQANYGDKKDRWRCTQGKYVTYRKIKYQKEHPEKHYLTTRSDCKGCPIAGKCIGKSHEKRIRITVYRDEYDRAIERVTSIKGKRMKTLRQSTVEPVFGTLINYGGMCKINPRGIEQANKVMLMAASAYNLKKLMNYIEKHRKIAAMVIKKEIVKQVENCVLILNVFYTAVKDTIKYTSLDIQKCTTPGNKFILASSGSIIELLNCNYSLKVVVQQLHLLGIVNFQSEVDIP